VIVEGDVILKEGAVETTFDFDKKPDTNAFDGSRRLVRGQERGKKTLARGSGETGAKKRVPQRERGDEGGTMTEAAYSLADQRLREGILYRNSRNPAYKEKERPLREERITSVSLKREGTRKRVDSASWGGVFKRTVPQRGSGDTKKEEKTMALRWECLSIVMSRIGSVIQGEEKSRVRKNETHPERFDGKGALV